MKAFLKNLINRKIQLDFEQGPSLKGTLVVKKGLFFVHTESKDIKVDVKLISGVKESIPA